MTPEKKFEGQIIEELNKRGWFAHHFDANGYDGWPDILALRGDEFRLIEVKAGTALRPSQTSLHATLRNLRDINVHVIERRKQAVILDDEVYAILHDAIMRLVG